MLTTTVSGRSYASTKPPRDIAVLGGGLTGLTTAYYLTKFLPSAKITLYERSGRLGGWIDTEKVEVESESGTVGHTLFERGARSVSPQHSQPKYDDLVLYDLVRSRPTPALMDCRVMRPLFLLTSPRVDPRPGSEPCDLRRSTRQMDPHVAALYLLSRPPCGSDTGAHERD